MDYKYEEQWKPLTFKGGDTLPIGSVVEFDGTDVPSGWVSVGNNKIKKTSQSAGLVGNVANDYSTSNKDSYSCEYVNNAISYSTEEHFTGKYWINGKPIYRRVIETRLNTVPVKIWTTLTNVNSIGINTILNIKLLATNNCVWDPGFTRMLNGDLQIYHNQCDAWNVVYTILEYTKTV